MMMGRRPLGVQFAEAAVPVSKGEDAPQSVASAPAADDGFPYEIFEQPGGASEPPEKWIDPYAGGTCLSMQSTPPTDLPFGALRRRGFKRS